MFSVEQIKTLNNLELEIYEYVIKNPDFPMSSVYINLQASVK